MRTFISRAGALVVAAAMLAGCTAEPPAAEGTPTPSATTAAPAETAPAAGCPPELVSAIAAEVAPTQVTEDPVAAPLPEGVVLEGAPTCVLSYGVLSEAARQVFYVGADAPRWQAFADAMTAAGFPAAAESYGGVSTGVVGAVWYRAGNDDRRTDTTIVNAGWVSGPEAEGAPSDAAILGTSYLVVTVEECPCE